MYVNSSARIGNVTGATPIPFDTPSAPRDWGPRGVRFRPDIQAACASSARIRGFPPHRASRMQTRNLLFCLLAGTALAACNREPTPADAASTTAPEAAATVPAYAFSDDITTRDCTERVKPLASDESEGRRAEEQTTEL